jgi:dihydrofolate reductase
MGSLLAIEFVTLDGVMQGYGSPDEDRDGGFAHGGWGLPYAVHRQPDDAPDGLRETSAYLFGRRTYEKMVEFWPRQPDDNPMAAHLNGSPKYVVSSTLTDPTWSHTTVVSGDLASTVGRLKREHEGNIVVLGSWSLLGALISQDLLDGYRLFVHPLLLGTGKRLFRALPSPQTLQLLDVQTSPSGIVMLAYARTSTAPGAAVSAGHDLQGTT